MMLVVALSAGLIGCGPGVAEDSGTRKESRPNVESGGGGDSGPAETGADTSGGGEDTAESGADSEETGVDAPCDRSLPWSYVAAGNYLSCGIHSDGCAECWGRGEAENSQPWDTAGYHWTGEDVPPRVPLTAVYITGEKVEYAVYFHTCGLTESGEAMCWGSNAYGESTVVGGTYAKLAVHSMATYGLSVDGDVVVWGTMGGPTAGPYVDISVGDDLVGVLTRDGDLEYWYTWSGERAEVVPGPFQRVAVGEATCVLTPEGAGECWHSIEGPGSWPDFQAATPASGLVDVCVGYFDTACGLQEDGHPVCWGSARWGLVREVDTTAVYTQIACGTDHACGLTPEGVIECWGDDFYGETIPPT